MERSRDDFGGLDCAELDASGTGNASSDARSSVNRPLGRELSVRMQFK